MHKTNQRSRLLSALILISIGVSSIHVAEAFSPVPAPVEKTGQINCFDPSKKTEDMIDCAGTGQDGETQTGTAWPIPRFVDNGDGSVIDKLTGVTWLKDASCDNFYEDDDRVNSFRPWEPALMAANNLADGKCGLSDGSVAGDWRLPTIKELQSMVNFNYFNPAFSNDSGADKWVRDGVFSGVLADSYWSSTNSIKSPKSAWFVYLYDGFSRSNFKSNNFNVWPVRVERQGK